MIQKIVNGIAIASGVVSLTVVGLGGYVYIRKDAIIEDIKGKVMESVGLGSLGGSLAPGIEIPDMASPQPAEPMSPIPLGF